MDLFLDYPLTSLFGIAVVVWVAVKLSHKPRRYLMSKGSVSCPRCGTKLPAVAKFCRQCGSEVV